MPAHTPAQSPAKIHSALRLIAEAVLLGLVMILVLMLGYVAAAPLDSEALPAPVTVFDPN